MEVEEEEKERKGRVQRCSLQKASARRKREGEVAHFDGRARRSRAAFAPTEL